jgi:hypothetical protein
MTRLAHPEIHTSQIIKMNKSMKLILAAAAAVFTFASCASKEVAPIQPPEVAMVDDGGVYSDK